MMDLFFGKLNDSMLGLSNLLPLAFPGGPSTRTLGSVIGPRETYPLAGNLKVAQVAVFQQAASVEGDFGDFSSI